MQAKPLSEVKKDFDPTKVKGVYNPTKEDITIEFGGVPYVIKAGSHEIHPEPMAFHFAKHIAIFIQNKGMKEFLLENFPGLNEQGREKWKVNANQFYSKKDILDLRDKLVFDYKVGEPAPVPTEEEVKPKFSSKKKAIVIPEEEKITEALTPKKVNKKTQPEE